MPTQTDTNGAIVDALPPAGSSVVPDTGLSPDIVTVRSGINYSFWLLVGLAAWLAMHSFKRRGSRRRPRRQVRHARARR